MNPDPGLPAEAVYAEREESPEPFFTRVWGDLTFWSRNAFARRLRAKDRLASRVAGHVQRVSAAPLAPRVPALRYQLRRSGIRPDLVEECFGLYASALAQRGLPAPTPEALGAGLVMLREGIAELGDQAAAAHGIGLAATVRAIMGAPVHVLAASAARASLLADTIAPPLDSLGIPLGRVMPETPAPARREAYAARVVCASYRDLATDYLRDRLQLRRMHGRVTSMLDHLSGNVPRGRLMLTGLHCALVADADMVMLDDALIALSLSAAADESQSRLLYEQALELARALVVGTDFVIGANGAQLTADGSERLARLVTPLGGVWAAARRREELLTTALDALHVLERDRDYRIEEGRVVFPAPEEADADEDAASIEALRKLVEIKEGCTENSRRDLLARISLPRFLSRYLILGGVCDDVRGAESELWRLYRRRPVAAGQYGETPRPGVRLFSAAMRKWTAIAEDARTHAARGGACVIAVRTVDEAQAGLGAFANAGLKPLIIRGGPGVAEQQTLARLDAAGNVALAVFPGERAVARRNSSGAPLHLIVAELRGTEREVAHLIKAFTPASCEIVLSLEDKAVGPHLKGGVALPSGMGEDGELPARAARRLAERIQSRAARAQSSSRRDLVSRDEHLRDLLAMTGVRE